MSIFILLFCVLQLLESVAECLAFSLVSFHFVFICLFVCLFSVSDIGSSEEKIRVNLTYRTGLFKAGLR